jgi:hypothetical protein
MTTPDPMGESRDDSMDQPGVAQRGAPSAPSERPAFPFNIESGDVVLVRARVLLTHKFIRDRAPTLEVDFGDGEFTSIPLAAAFGIVTSVNGEKP